MRPLIALLAILIFAVTQAQTNPLDIIQWSPLRMGEHSNIKQARTDVFQTAGQFETYWRDHTGSNDAPKDVNWATELVIAIHLGERSSGGYGVGIQSIKREGPSIVMVTYLERSPAGIASSVMTSPWMVIKVKRVAGSFSFKKVSQPNGLIISDSMGPVWRTFMSEQTGGGNVSREVVITNEKDFQQYWRAVFNEDAPRESIDWSREALIALHAGTQSSTGYDVLIDSVGQVPGGIRVCYVLKAPSVGQKVRRTPTSPFTIIRIPQFSGRVSFIRRTWNSEG